MLQRVVCNTYADSFMVNDSWSILLIRKPIAYFIQWYIVTWLFNVLQTDGGIVSLNVFFKCRWIAPDGKSRNYIHMIIMRFNSSATIPILSQFRYCCRPDKLQMCEENRNALLKHSKNVWDSKQKRLKEIKCNFV